LTHFCVRLRGRKKNKPVLPTGVSGTLSGIAYIIKKYPGSTQNFWLSKSKLGLWLCSSNKFSVVNDVNFGSHLINQWNNKECITF
jgi:hypothetical protein